MNKQTWVDTWVKPKLGFFLGTIGESVSSAEPIMHGRGENTLERPYGRNSEKKKDPALLAIITGH